MYNSSSRESSMIATRHSSGCETLISISFFMKLYGPVCELDLRRQHRLRHCLAQLFVQEAFDLPRVVHLQRAAGDDLALGQAHPAANALDLGHGAGGHAQRA